MKRNALLVIVGSLVVIAAVTILIALVFYRFDQERQRTCEASALTRHAFNVYLVKSFAVTEEARKLNINIYPDPRLRPLQMELEHAAHILNDSLTAARATGCTT